MGNVKKTEGIVHKIETSTRHSFFVRRATEKKKENGKNRGKSTRHPFFVRRATEMKENAKIVESQDVMFFVRFATEKKKCKNRFWD